MKNMITLKTRKRTNCNHLQLCGLIVKLTHIVYKNISYGKLGFTEHLFEVGRNCQKTKLVLEQNWSIHTSRCIVVLSVLLEDYTTVYACC